MVKFTKIRDAFKLTIKVDDIDLTAKRSSDIKLQIMKC